MAKTSKVIYKPDSQSTEEFTCIVNSEEYKKWKDGDTTIPLAEVVDSFQVFVSTQGAQGVLGKPSHQQLDTVFNSHKDVDVVTIILKEGREQVTDGVTSSPFTGTNAARGDGNVNVRGAGGGRA